MLHSTKKRLWFVLTGLGLLLAASVLTACTVSVSGGIAGVISAVALGAALLGLGAGASGCDDSVNSCLSPPDVRACLSMDVGACLSLPNDAGPDGAAPAEVGPCLQPPLPDAGPDTSPPDAATPDAHIGPCLSPRPPDTGVGALDPALQQGPAPAPESREMQRSHAIARLAARLPPDVAERLGVPGDDETA